MFNFVQDQGRIKSGRFKTGSNICRKADMDNKLQSIFITGASSRIGQMIVNALSGKTHLFLLQNRRALENLNNKNITILRGGLDACPHHRDKIRQSDIILHIAGITHTDDMETYYKVNHKGTQRLLDAAGHKNRHFIYLSTRCIGEIGGAYSHSKYLAESEVQQSGMPHTIIRPSEIYGSSSKEGIDALLLIASKMRMIVDFKFQPEITYSPISIHELVLFIASVIQRDQPKNNVYTLCNDESYTARQIAAALQERYNRRIYRISIPLELIRFLFKLHVPLPFKKDQVDRLIMKKSTDNRTAKEDFGFHPVPFLDFIKNAFINN